MLADLAYGFHFQPSELWAMDSDELLFWHGELERISEQIKRGR